MSSSAVAACRATSRFPLLVFLAVTGAVRAFHLLNWPQIVWGMNHLTASSAKEVLQDGIADAVLILPALPPLLLAVPAAVLNIPPGRCVLAVTLFSTLVYAVAFWIWLTSLRLSPRLRLFSCLAFLFLPYHNGYTGLCSLPTFWAGTIFLFIASVLNEFLRDASRKRLAIITLLSGLLPWIRSEYVLLLPLYAAMILPAHRFFFRAWLPRRGWVVIGGILIGLACGAGSAVGFRYWNWGELNLVPNQYACWTFLDGMPARWLAPSDDSEYDRRIVGIEHFGSPADYDFSLLKMVARNPGQTLAKFVLSIPRWLQELGHRDQVEPRPAAMLALLGFLFLIRNRRSSHRLLVAAQASSLVLVTVPLIAVMLYAEYLRPAYPAMLCLMSYGALAVAVTGRLLWRRFPSRTCFYGMAAFLCFGLEYLYFPSEAYLPGVPVYSVVGKEIDRLVGQHDLGQVLLDPYSGIVDSTSCVPFKNRSLEREVILKDGPESRKPPQVFDVIDLAGRAGFRRYDAVVVWERLDDLPNELSPTDFPTARRWNAAGFQTAVTRQWTDNAGHHWRIELCRRSREGE